MVIGLEIHVQLKTKSKIFCSCPNAYGGSPNSQVCPVCLGHPGVLPVVNGAAVDLAILVGLAMGSEINLRSGWARKHYFYPDLPKGYQITQYHRPLISGGRIELPLGNKQIRIRRLHLEEDAGKLKHTLLDGTPVTKIDLNRCGAPLLEIVTEPDLRTPDEAVLFLTAIKQLLQYSGASDAAMEKGQLRCDANISTRPVGEISLGAKTEIKNLNSFRNVARALRAESRRQIQVREGGGVVEPITLLWDKHSHAIRRMRKKEGSSDYRYFPEPDLPDLDITEQQIADCRERLPELPAARLNRFMTEYHLRPADAHLMTTSIDLADFFEEVARQVRSCQTAANIIGTNLLHLLKGSPYRITTSPVTPSALVELLRLIEAGSISHTIAVRVLEEIFATGRSAEQIVEENRWAQVVGSAQIAAWVQEVLAQHREKVADYRRGRESIINFLVGEVMKRSDGRAPPRKIRQMIIVALTEGEQTNPDGD